MALKKLWRPMKEWVPHEWVPMWEAWVRVEAAVRYWSLTKRNIKADLRAGRLVGAACVVNKKDGTERWIIFEREFWEPVEFPYAHQVTGYDEHYREGEEWYFFVHRRKLDKRYPAAANATPTEAAVKRTRRRKDKPKVAQSPSQPTEEQIQELMGDVSGLSDLQKKIRRYAVLKYGAQWRDHDPAEVQKNARNDPLYKKEVGDIVYHITTFRRGLGRKIN